MTTTQLFFAIAGVVSTEIAVLVVFMLHQFGRIETRLLVIEGDLRRFYQIIGEHSGKLESIEKKLG